MVSGLSHGFGGELLATYYIKQKIKLILHQKGRTLRWGYVLLKKRIFSLPFF
jgi:hypothetical protein